MNCEFCYDREGGCRFCHAPPQVEASQFIKEEPIFRDDLVLLVRTTVVREVWRVPPPHPDTVPCDPDPRLEHLFDERSQVERGVAMIVYDPDWPRQLNRILKRAGKYRKRSAKPRLDPKFERAWWK